MKRPTMLFQALLAQASMELGLSTERDFRTIGSRFEHEGLSFLTITLPRLSDALEEGIESGRFSLPLGFKRGRGRLPALLQGFFNRVFNEGGDLLADACAESILWIRQIARFYKKPKLSCSPSREREAIRKFKQVEEDLFYATQSVNRQDDVLDATASILWSTLFYDVDPTSIVCGHGPGVTADRLLSNERRRIRFWYTRAEGSFSASDHAFHNWAACFEEGTTGGNLKDLEYRDIRCEPGVRVVFVPKTLTTPRVIAIEPSTMQFMQQGLSRYMVRVLEHHYLTSGSVNFTDQSVNQELARSSSIDRSLATLDLSDASDRVHLELVRRIFRRSDILEKLEDLRSLHADLPDGSNLILKKYASMGSALCFPVEACVFYTLILAAIFRSTGQKPNYRSISRLKKVVKVYGDDLIVPVEHVDAVSDYLESYALRVNRRKSFSASAFRESCGSDFYNGTSVKPVYARMDIPERRSEWTPNHIMSWTSTANQFYERGWWIVAQAIRDMVSSVVVTQIPISRDYDHGICFASCFQERNLSYDRRLHNWRQRRLVFTPVKTKDEIDDDYYACYNRAFEAHTRHDGLLDTFGGISPSFDYRRVAPQRAATSEWHHDLHHPERDDDDLGERRLCGGENSPSPQNLQHPQSSVVACLAKANSYISQDSFCGRNLFRVIPGRSFGANTARDDRLLDLLDESIAAEAIDFHCTVKRGVFKPKRRWVTVVQ